MEIIDSKILSDRRNDIVEHELNEELNMFKDVYKKRQYYLIVSVEILNKKITEDNTTPVIVASAERSFSRLKIVETYLTNSMSRDRFSTFEPCYSVNHSLDYCTLILVVQINFEIHLICIH